MTIKITHTEFANASPEHVWSLWSDVSTWAIWDHGVQWCRMKEGHQFQVGGEALLQPKGAPVPVHVRIVDCAPNKCFTDEGSLDLGLIRFSHEIAPHKGGVMITHTLNFIPANPKAKEIFETRMLSKLQQELPESVKSIAKLAEGKRR